MRSKLPGILVAWPLFLLSGCAHSPGSTIKHEVLPFVGGFKVHRYIFSNGLKLLVSPDSSSPTFAYNTWFRVGSRDEVPGYTGLAHLFEHMMFKQTKNLKEGEYDRTLEEAGVEHLNAFTSRDYTTYVQELPTDKLELITRLESERMVNLEVNDASFKTEREVVKNERKFRTDNSPEGKMFEELFGLGIQKHPYHWPVVGYEEDLNRMSAEDARRFYQKFYSPDHATICVVGNVNPDTVASLVSRYYGKIPASNLPPGIPAAEPEPSSPRRKTLSLNVQVEKLMMGYLTPELTHPDTSALILLRGILSGGKSSRLYRALVETGIANSVAAYESDDRDPSLYIIMASMQSRKSANQAERIILRELERLSREPVPAAELERALNGLSFEFYQTLENNYERANYMGRFETVAGTFEVGMKLREDLKAVTPLDIQRVARRYFKPSRRTVIVGIKK